MKKKYVYYLIGFLLLVLISLVFMAREDISRRRSLLADKMLILSFEDREKEVSLQDIADLPAMTINTTLRSSTASDRDVSYTGLPLKDVLEAFLPGALEKAGAVITRAADGYTVALQAQEVRQANNVYLVYAEDNIWLPPREEGGPGPMKTIVAQDTFGQRWCKYLIEVSLQ